MSSSGKKSKERHHKKHRKEEVKESWHVKSLEEILVEKKRRREREDDQQDDPSDKKLLKLKHLEDGELTVQRDATTATASPLRRKQSSGDEKMEDDVLQIKPPQIGKSKTKESSHGKDQKKKHSKNRDKSERKHKRHKRSRSKDKSKRRSQEERSHHKERAPRVLPRPSSRSHDRNHHHESGRYGDTAHRQGMDHHGPMHHGNAPRFEMERHGDGERYRYEQPRRDRYTGPSMFGERDRQYDGQTRTDHPMREFDRGHRGKDWGRFQHAGNYWQHKESKYEHRFADRMDMSRDRHSADERKTTREHSPLLARDPEVKPTDESSNRPATDVVSDSDPKDQAQEVISLVKTTTDEATSSEEDNEADSSSSEAAESGDPSNKESESEEGDSDDDDSSSEVEELSDDEQAEGVELSSEEHESSGSEESESDSESESENGSKASGSGSDHSEAEVERMQEKRKLEQDEGPRKRTSQSQNIQKSKFDNSSSPEADPHDYLPDSPPDSPVELRERLPAYYPAISGCRSVEEFTCLNRIEEGTFGVVYRAKEKRTDEVVALKRLKMEKEKEGFPITSLREVNTLLKAQHPNIVTVREIVVGSNMDKIYIVMEYVEHDLKCLMETMKQPFTIGETKCLMVQLLRGVHHLHDNWILHRDLKLSNLLLSHRGELKIGDFGLAREYGSPLKNYTPIVVTLWYRSPELLLGVKEYSCPVDMWSVGCIFAELVKMKPLFPGRSEIDQLNRIFKELGTPSEKIWPGYNELPAVKKMTFAEHPYNNLRNCIGSIVTDVGFDLMNRFLTYNPERRITADEGLKHIYFRESPQPIDESMFPTWPAKSEMPRSAKRSPKAPEGGLQYSKLDDDGLATEEGFRMTLASQGTSVKTAGFNLRF